MATLSVSGVVLFIKEAYKPYKFHKDVKAALENFGKAGADGEFWYVLYLSITFIVLPS